VSSDNFASLFAVDIADKKTEQVGFKVDAKLYRDLELAADREDRKRNELARRLFELIFNKYRETAAIVPPDQVFSRLKAVIDKVDMESVLNGIVNTPSLVISKGPSASNESGPRQIGESARPDTDQGTDNALKLAKEVIHETRAQGSKRKVNTNQK
jgi:hypothetical protein